MGQVQNKVAIVTGGASGIGAECAVTLAREGAKMLVRTSMTRAVSWLWIRSAAPRLGGLFASRRNPRRDLAGGDRSGRAAIWPAGRDGGKRLYRDHVSGCRDDPGRLAAPNRSEPRRRVPVRQVRGRALRRAGGGSIIITSSTAGLRGSPGLAGYCATKRGVRLFAKAVAIEHAADNIRVNTVHPGVIDTPIWTKLRCLPGAIRRSIRARWRRPGSPSAELDRRRTSPIACCSWPLTRRVM